MSFPNPAASGAVERAGMPEFIARSRADIQRSVTCPTIFAAVALSVMASAGGCGGPAQPAASSNASGANSSGSPPAPSVAWFTEITDDAGLDFVHYSDADENFRMPEIMGAGCAMFDADGDGDLDLYLINGSRELTGRADGPAPRNRLYRQEADGTFTDATDASGLGDENYGFGVAVGDIDNDGDLDVYLTNRGPDRLYLNDGTGVFTDVTEAAGIDVGGWSCSATFVDYDRDGDLDLYVARYVIWDPSQRCSDPAGRNDYCGPQVFEGFPDVLLRNEGDGTFTDVSIEAGMAARKNPGLGVVCDDFDGDGWIDIAVANDGAENFLWMNQRDGTFRDEALMQGIAVNMHGDSEAGMGIIAHDFNDDGAPDLFMTHLSLQTNTYYQNRGGGTGFDDLTGPVGLGSSSQAFTGFGTATFDVQLDGHLDLLVANGKVQRGERRADSSIGPPWNRYAEPNLLYQGDGQGSFHPVNDHSTYNTWVEMTRGLSVGDIDRDGDLDVLFSNNLGPARLYRNDAPRAGHWLMIRAFEPDLNRDAIGAQVIVVIDGRRLRRTIGRGSSYLSSHDAHAHFGLGEHENIERVEVQWADGTREFFSGVGADRYVTIRRGEGEAPS